VTFKNGKVVKNRFVDIGALAVVAASVIFWGSFQVMGLSLMTCGFNQLSPFPPPCDYEQIHATQNMLVILSAVLWGVGVLSLIVGCKIKKK
jgi:hypothetical protein